MSDNCPVCKTMLNGKKATQNSAFSTHAYDCPRCGKFVFTFSESELAMTLNYGHDDYKIFVLSYNIRKMQKKDDSEIVLDGNLVDRILKGALPTVAEQKDIFIRWVGDNSKTGGNYVKVNKYSIQAIIGATKLEEYSFILEYLTTIGMIKRSYKVTSSQNTSVEPPERKQMLDGVTLSFDGWRYYEQLKKGAVDSRTAFMAMEYGNSELDGIVENYFKPAVKSTGFELFRLDEKPKAGLIDDRLRVEIRNSRFLIADLSGGNKGAYWEAGYAEGLGKPVIYTCKKKVFESEESQPHFDANHHLTVIWDIANIQDAVEMLKATIRATLPDEAKLSGD